MEQYLELIKCSPLFKGVACKEDMLAILDCLDVKKVDYKAKTTILRAGDSISEFGLVVKGAVIISSSDYWGNQNILKKVMPGGHFAEVFAIHTHEKMLVDVVAETDTSILWLNPVRIVSGVGTCRSSHMVIVKNLLQLIAVNNIHLSRKILHITKRSTREKLLAYLSDQAHLQHTSKFTIAFNRQQLADYLSVDRSSMSAELSKLQKEGYIRYHKNNFELLKLKVYEG